MPCSRQASTISSSTPREISDHSIWRSAIGATTENPSFGVVAALLSRARVVRLEVLPDAELAALAQRAVIDHERGLGALDVTLGDDALARLEEAFPAGVAAGSRYAESQMAMLDSER